MFSVELPPDQTPWRWETKTVDVESEIRKAVLAERNRCAMLVLRNSDSPTLADLALQILEEPK